MSHAAFYALGRLQAEEPMAPDGRTATREGDVGISACGMMSIQRRLDDNTQYAVRYGSERTENVVQVKTFNE